MAGTFDAACNLLPGLCQPLITDKWSGGLSGPCCTCSQPLCRLLCSRSALASSPLPWPGWPRPRSQPCQSLSLLTLAPQPLQGAGGVTWGTAWKPLAGAGVTVNARLNQDSFSSFKNEILKVLLHRCREGEVIPWKVKNRTLKGCC